MENYYNIKISPEVIKNDIKNDLNDKINDVKEEIQNSKKEVVTVVNTKQFTVTPSPTTQLIGTKNVVSGNLPATITPGGTVKFLDTSVRSPWQFAPTGWNWVFGPSASPTGSTGQNPTVTYGTTGAYTVTLTASNAAGSTAKTKTNFVIVTY